MLFFVSIFIFACAIVHAKNNFHESGAFAVSSTELDEELIPVHENFADEIVTAGNQQEAGSKIHNLIYAGAEMEIKRDSYTAA